MSTVTGPSSHRPAAPQVPPLTLGSTVQAVRDKGIASLAVVLKHSYIFPDHEKQVGDVASELGFSQVPAHSRWPHNPPESICKNTLGRPPSLPGYSNVRGAISRWSRMRTAAYNSKDLLTPPWPCTVPVADAGQPVQRSDARGEDGAARLHCRRGRLPHTPHPQATPSVVLPAHTCRRGWN